MSMDDTSIGKYLKVRRLEGSRSGKTFRWAILNNTQGAVLGEIGWSGRWRQYVFEPYGDGMFNAGCLEDIAQFLATVTTRHREARR